MAQSKIDSNQAQWMDPETGSTSEQKWAEEGSEAQVGGAFFILGILGVVELK